MFNTKEEFILALMEGRKFKSVNGVTVEYNQDCQVPFITSNGTLRNFDVYHTVTEVFTNWYDDPTNVGKLCWCWDSDTDWMLVARFEKYTKNVYPYVTSAGCYANSRLLTTEELSVLGGIEQIKNT